MTAALSPPPPAQSTGQHAQLEAHEEAIRKGLCAYRDVGAALAAIRAEKLYRLTPYRTFRAYCKGRWSFTSHYACRLMRAAEVAALLERAGLPVPLRQKTAHVLSTLPDSRICAAWKQALEQAGPGRQATAAAVAKVIADPGGAGQPAGPRQSPSARAVVQLVATLGRARQLVGNLTTLPEARHLADVLERAAELAGRLATT